MGNRGFAADQDAELVGVFCAEYAHVAHRVKILIFNWGVQVDRDVVCDSRGHIHGLGRIKRYQLVQGGYRKGVGGDAIDAEGRDCMGKVGCMLKNGVSGKYALQGGVRHHGTSEVVFGVRGTGQGAHMVRGHMVHARVPHLKTRAPVDPTLCRTEHAIDLIEAAARDVAVAVHVEKGEEQVVDGLDQLPRARFHKQQIKLHA